ncbi:MAG: tyrosine-type recombinase/integrase [Bacteroidota bacterium]
MLNIYLRLDTSTKLKKTGAHPILLMITRGSEVRHKRIKGFSCKKESWDFENRCFLHSERKNALLKAYLKKARRVADYMDEWDYGRFVEELKRADEKKEPTQKKLFEYLKELQDYYYENDQMAYSYEFKGLISFLRKCFKKDMRLQHFGDRELKIVLKKFDERGIKGWNYLKGLKTAYCQAMEKGYLKPEDCPFKTQYSPMGYNINKRNSKASVKVKKNRIKDMTEEEKEMVVEFYRTADIPPTQKKHLAYWVLGYKLFGVNFIDLAHLKWDDINNRYWKYTRSKTGIGSASGKPVPEEAMEILREYDTGGKYILDVLNGYDESAERIHTRLRNYRANMRRTFRVLSKRINFTDDRYITWYTTRYTSITLTIEKGVDLNVVKTLADHSSIKTTSKYVGIVKDRNRLKEAMDLL